MAHRRVEAARGVLGEFSQLSDSERLAGNLHRAMAELIGPEANAATSVGEAISDMLKLNGGKLLHCVA